MERIDGIVETYESVAETYRNRHDDRSFAEPLLDAFAERVDDGRVLDAGCGPGWESAALAERGFSVLGIDVASAFLRAADGHAAGAAFARMDMRRLGLRRGIVDGIWACGSFLHVPRTEADATLAEFERVLAPEGTLFLLVKRGDGVVESQTYDGDRRTFTLYQPGALRDRLERAGFAVDDLRVETGSDTEWVRAFARRDGSLSS